MLASALTGHSPGGLGCRLADADGAGPPATVVKELRAELGMTGQVSGRTVTLRRPRPRAPGRPARGPWPTPSTTAPSRVTVGDRTWSRSRDESGWSLAAGPHARACHRPSC